MVALWRETDIQAPSRPEGGGLPPCTPRPGRPPRSHTRRPSGRPPYQHVVSVITARACRRVSRIAGLGWILQPIRRC